MTTKLLFRRMRAEAFRSGLAETEILFMADPQKITESLTITSEVDLFHAMNRTRVYEAPPPPEYVNLPLIRWFQQELRFPSAEAFLRRPRPFRVHLPSSEIAK